MSEAETRTVGADEGEVRLDRWFRRHFPEIGHGRLQKLLRTGQVRVDGRRAQASARLRPGQAIRIPPLSADQPSPARSRPAPDRVDPTDAEADAEALRSRVRYEDHALIVLDKPAGLAVQGGTGTRRHVDGMLQAWAAGGERPRLVHRLDRDTSGLLVVAKTPVVAAKLTEAFRRQRVEKLYWALVLGRPPEAQGWIDQPLAKQPGKGGERVGASGRGLAARTLYRVVARAGKVASWLAL
jgi:23S rRNA pseudouridine955/2504/2580 synthase